MDAVVVIELQARPKPPSQPTGSQYAAKSPCPEWTVDICVSGKKSLRDVALKDPLSTEQRRLCSWYLEEYTQKTPYSVEPGEDARALLEEYPKRLWRELRLAEVVSSLENAGWGKPQRLIIRPSEYGRPLEDSNSTIHQLFWETLEYLDKTTTFGWQVIIERHLSPAGGAGFSPTKRVRSWDVRREDVTTVNILLVIARDTSRNPETYNDVCPFLAFEALSKVQQKLNGGGGRLRFHVEIARPGTFASLKEHLRRAKQVNGPGYFQIVHFDMHGTVKTINRVKVGLLYFGRKRSDGLHAVPALNVANLLREYEIPSVVLNACNSARASSGDDANIASVLQRRGGVGNVLAMSFKVSSAAVDLFFASFYQSLLIDRLTFVASSSKAREALRANMLRPARFGLERELLDAFVPVLYGCGDDCPLVEDDASQNDSVENSALFSSTSTTIPTVSSLPYLKPVGRDLDLMRLEKVLFESPIVYLHGPAGVGKSSLLRYAAELWLKTCFANAVVVIDFAMERILSGPDFANAVLNQLLQTQAQSERPQLWTIPSLRKQSHSLDAIQDIITNVLSTCDAILIIDGLDMLFSPFRAHVASNSPHAGSARLEIFEIIKSIVMSSTSPELGGRSRVVLIARRIDHQWLGAIFNQASTVQSFELQSLELSDSIELSQNILSNAGEDVAKWGSRDFDWLEAIIDLLHGIPLALMEILPLQREFRIPWREFYNRLHGGLFNSLPDLKGRGPYPILEELFYLSAALPRDCFVLLLLFSCYWGETPPLEVFERLFLTVSREENGPSTQIGSEQESLVEWYSNILGLAIDRGYIRCELGSNIAWVHPLFTIYARAFVPQFTPHLRHPWMQELILKSIQLIPFRWQGTKGSPTGGYDGASEPCIRFTKCGGDANVLTCIKLGLELASQIPTTQLPIHLLQSYLEDNSISIHMGDSFLDFLSLCVERSRGDDALDSTPLGFCVMSIAGILENKRLFLWCRDRGQKLMHLCIDMVQILDQYHWANPLPKNTIYKALLLLPLFHHRGIFDAHMSTLHGIQGIGVLKDKTSKDLREIFQELCTNNRVTSLPAELFLKPELLGSLKHELDMLIRGLDGHEFSESSMQNDIKSASKIPDMPNWQDPFQRLIHKHTQGAARAELAEASRCSPWKIRVEFPKRNHVLSPILQDLEDATDTGDCAEAFLQHVKLLCDALDKTLFGEADQHIESLRKLCRMMAGLDILGPHLDNLKKEVNQRRLRFEFALSLFPSVEGGWRGDAIQVQKEYLSLMADIAPLHCFLASSWCDKMAAKQGGSGYLSAVSREKMRQIMRNHTGFLGNPDSVKSMTVIQENFLETLMLAKQAMKQKEFSTCLAHVDSLEELIEKNDWLRDIFKELNAVETIREACRRDMSFYDRLYTWSSAVLDGEYDRAQSVIDEISNLSLSELPEAWAPDHLVRLQAATKLEQLMEEIADARSHYDIERVRELHAEFTSSWKRYKPMNISEVEDAITENLEWLLEQLLNNMQWQKGLEVCDKGLEYFASLDEETSFGRQQLDIIRERCQAALLNESLFAAEAASDFSACIESLNRLETLWKHQQQTKSQPRPFILRLSEKLVEFLRSCYADGCIPCARWARCQEEHQLYT
ncbi:hypothetical protein MW887_006711 [Aspergillus wentii]|nr:hypothetical protein MW887_006711 [Aspergillus wentii]